MLVYQRAMANDANYESLRSWLRNKTCASQEPTIFHRLQHKLCFFLGELLKLGITNMVHWCTGAGSMRLVELGLCYPWGRQSPLVGYRLFLLPGGILRQRNHVAKESVPSATFIGNSPTSMKQNCPRFRWLIPI